MEKQNDKWITKEKIDKFFPKKDIDILGYKSPIELFLGEIRTKQEDGIFTVIQEYGVSVDKSELVKALQYDRNQYEIGYVNGYKTKAYDVAKEIFAEIDNILSKKIDVTKKNERRAEYLAHNDMKHLYSTLVGVFEKLRENYAELKKKYESEGEG